ncbi:MAG: AMP-binding protein [Bryobacteraceae bacterium]|nr:AMP-binding protein [Bryobacteraceae bacterium]
MVSLYGTLEERARSHPESVALLGLGRDPLDYRSLVRLIEDAVRQLNGAGIGRNDRVALVLPDGPATAAAFLAVASGATCAPLNPGYRAEEFDFYLSDLRAKAVLLPEGADSPVRGVAAARGIATIELAEPPGAPAGWFHLKLTSTPAERPAFGAAEDVALALHTSGTTSRPKVVPLTQANLLASARQIGATLRLGPDDRCLNVMPLFHIHGLAGALLSSIAAGAQVVCTPGFHAPSFFDWLDEFRPTWYSAVPTMHQAILSRVASNREKASRSSLRFIRSSSAALAPRVMSELEGAFGVPVVESYGMTEASHQMASNPLPPGVRKPGSVGLAAGPDVAVMDDAGDLLPVGARGEIVVRGPSITAGYENNPAANRSAFTNGWFRTGDQGFLDEDGYLFLTGRLKEIINRGGEKISPREIDEVLLEHPAVAQAVAFALPDARLGEDIGAAIVLRPGAAATESELRLFVAERLADFKTPRRIVFVPEIPKGPSGKLQRIGLADKLGLNEPVEAAVPETYAAPRTETERRLCAIWTDLLRVERAGVRDNFFNIGGDSILAAQLLSRIREEFGVHLPMVALFEAATIEAQAGIVSRDGWAPSWRFLAPLRASGSRPPLFCVHAQKGDVFFYREMVKSLGPEQPVYGVRAAEADGANGPPSLEEMSARYVAELRTVQPRGPYYIAGYCVGAYVALEMARQIEEQGETVALLIPFNTDGSWRGIGGFRDGVRFHRRNLGALPPRQKLLYVLRRAQFRSRRIGRSLKETAYELCLRAGLRPPEALRKVHAWEVNYRASRDYRPRPIQAHVVYFHGAGDPHKDPRPFWGDIARGGLEIWNVPGSDIHIFDAPNAAILGERLEERLKRAYEEYQARTAAAVLQTTSSIT